MMSSRATSFVGKSFPELVLPDHAGHERRLDELVGDDPLMLQFYRGWWCPKEQAFFQKVIDLQAEAEVAYTRFLSVSVDAPEVCAAFRAGLGARWTFLSDSEHRYVKQLGLEESTDTTHSPYLPTVFVLKPGAVVHSAYDGYWFWGRPTMDELRMDFRTVTAELRPDWEMPQP